MKIKTKYNIGDTIIYEDNGLKTAKILSFEITYLPLSGINIKYELGGFQENIYKKFKLYESSILCRATIKNLIRKTLANEVDNEKI